MNAVLVPVIVLDPAVKVIVPVACTISLFDSPSLFINVYSILLPLTSAASSSVCKCIACNGSDLVFPLSKAPS